MKLRDEAIVLYAHSGPNRAERRARKLAGPSVNRPATRAELEAAMPEPPEHPLFLLR